MLAFKSIKRYKKSSILGHFYWSRNKISSNIYTKAVKTCINPYDVTAETAGVHMATNNAALINVKPIYNGALIERVGLAACRKGRLFMLLTAVKL